ncbi:TetR family transcriptional regulator [uncultured Alistipes sp.]|uniref:TetR/AcrR family transcriptional regulator n=1 Tax=uncultured Alistipes sp. TaxID=538949 RepID=UPI00258BED78|nr:TetR family transcriptional regulator [uncultured Alistipes sp.]
MERNQMLDAAYRIFIREGIQDLRMRTLAGKIGITKQELDACFANKQDLVTQSVERALSLLNERMDAACRTAATPLEAFVRLAAGIYDTFGKVSDLFIDDAEYYPAVVDVIGYERHTLQERLRDLFDDGVRQGYLLGTEYFDMFGELFWPGMTAGRDRDAAGKALFMFLRGSSTEKGWLEMQRLRQLKETFAEDE